MALRRLLPLVLLAPLGAWGCGDGSAPESAPQNIRRESLKPDQRAAIESDEARYGIKIGP